MPRRPRPVRPRAALLAVALTAVAGTLAAAPAAPAAPSVPAPSAAAPSGTVTNPVSASFGDTFADPTVIRGLDGAWYAYATADALRSGEGRRHGIPIARSTDLVRWTHAGDAFPLEDLLPPYAAERSGVWAPDIRYFGGRYVMYYSVADTTASAAGNDAAVGVATAPTPTGPWTHHDEPVVPSWQREDGSWAVVIDPAVVTTREGERYLYYGTFATGVWAQQLSEDGLSTVGPRRLITRQARYEAPYVVERDGWYHLFGTSPTCCSGPASGYTVYSGRSRSPLGPFEDRQGRRLDASRSGGHLVLAPTGNRWIGTGHNAVLRDLSGQDHLVYHAIDRDEPYLDEPLGVNRRPMLVDRLDWIDGWPVVRAGAGASQDAQPAPVADAPVRARFEHGLDRDWRAAGRWDTARGPEGGFARGHGVLTSGREVPRDARVEAHIRLGDARTAELRLPGVRVGLDRRAGTLYAVGADGRREQPLPAGFRHDRWHHLAVETRGGRVGVEVSDAGLDGALARVTARREAPADGDRLRVLTTGGHADLDNVSAAPLAPPAPDPVPQFRAGPEIPGTRQEFDGEELGAGWEWVRENPAVRVEDGALRWPLEAGDLGDAQPTPGVLLREETPGGDWIAETRMTLPLGTDTRRDYQQAGLVAYAADDDFAKLTSVATADTRQASFFRRLQWEGERVTGFGMVGTTADTVWLRLARTEDPDTGETVLRAATSTDGERWVWGNTWTFEEGRQVRVGLVAHGGATPAVEAAFDYLRFHRLQQGESTR